MGVPGPVWVTSSFCSLTSMFWIYSTAARNSSNAGAVSVTLQFHRCGRQAPVEIAPAHQRPPFVKEYLDRPPIRDPGDDDQALLEEARKRRGVEASSHELSHCQCN